MAATRQAIADATRFDPRNINRNFSYDYAAYQTVKRNFGRLIQAGHLREVMALALELMDLGSHQVEMSDEGLMTDDVNECLQVAIEGVEQSDLPAREALAWCAAMSKKDRVGFLCDEELEALRERLESSET
jgi:hypothetical protein